MEGNLSKHGVCQYLNPNWYKNGVRKINVDTDIRPAMTAGIRKVMAENPKEFDPRSYLKEGRRIAKEMIAKRMIDFGQAGHANEYVAKV